MHRLHVLGTVAASLLLAAALPVRAADVGGAAEDAGDAIGNAAGATGHAVKEGAEATGHYVKEGAEATAGAVGGAMRATGDFIGITGGEKVSAADAVSYEEAEKAQHQMTGTVTDVDRDDGIVQLRTDEGTLKLPFQPASIQQVREGDRVTVELAYVKLPLQTKAAKSVQEERSARHAATIDEATKDRWMRGTVSDLDRSAGTFALESGGTTAQVHFPPSKIETLENGDQVAVQVGMMRQGTGQQPSAPDNR